ncbi:TonB-dependent receptor [Lewinellaceae bacterium SD302]|nr:TonB-dependent receptor [Lewinellaceae bacterium SD302]
MLRFSRIIALILLSTTTLFAQKIVGTISGTDAPDGLEGAAVLLVGTLNGTVTDADGRFTIGQQVEYGKQQLRISLLGYRTRTITVSLSPNQPIAAVDVILEPGSFDLDELTVSATRAAANTPVTYVNVGKDEIAANNLGQDLPFVLKWTPSVVVTSDAGAGVGYTGIWIRGSDPARTNVTINGIPFNDSESQGTFWVNLPDFASSAEEIQIQRGVGTSTNGAGAFGATINIATNDFKDESYGSIDAGIGSFGTRRANLRFGTGMLKDGFSVDGRVSKINSDGYIDRASSDLTGYYLSAGRKGKKSVLRFNLFGGHEVTYQAWNGVDASLIDDRDLRTTNTAGTEKEGEPYDNEVDNYQQTHGQLHYSLDLGSGLGLNLSGHYTKGMGYFEQYKADEDLADYGIEPLGSGILDGTSDLIRRRWLDNDFYGLVYSLKYASRNEYTTATLGGGYHRYEGDHFGEVIWARNAGDSEIRDLYYDNDATKNDFNVFGKVNHRIAAGLSAYVDLQLRLVDYQFLGLDNNLERVDQDVNHTFFNPKAGLFYRLSPRTEAYASFGVAQREPNRNDFVDNPVSTRPTPEKLYNTEVGYRTTGNRANFGANFYHMLYRDQLVLNGRLNDVGEYIRVNVPNSYRLGLELQGGYAITPRFTAAANLTLSRNRVKNYVEFLDDFDEEFNYLGQVEVEREDTPLAFSPDFLAGGQLSYDILASDLQKLTATLLGKYVGQRYLDNSGDEDNTIPAYFYADARLQYSIDAPRLPKFRINFQVNNLFDQLYSANGWSYRYQFDGNPTLLQGFYPQATRNFLLGVGIDF